MNIRDILKTVDHTLLSQSAVWEEIKVICDDAAQYGCASVCIPPSYVKKASEYLCGKVKVCTVIGFPNGYNTTAVKCFETRQAVLDGADEIDMVINIGMLRERRFDEVLDEIKAVRAECTDKILKVIIETCLLNEEEKIKMCEIVSDSGADFIKTSTGFSTGGAIREDVALMAKHVKPGLKIKAAGGISGLEDAEDFINLGAQRLGTSRIVKIIKGLK